MRLVPLMKLHHINIAAPAAMLEEAKTFYCDILGLKTGFRPKLKTPGYWLYGELGPIVHLSESDIHSSSDQKHYLDHVAFSDRNLSNRLQLLDEAGLDYKLRKIEEDILVHSSSISKKLKEDDYCICVSKGTNYVFYIKKLT